MEGPAVCSALIHAATLVMAGILIFIILNDGQAAGESRERPIAWQWAEKKLEPWQKSRARGPTSRAAARKTGFPGFWPEIRAPSPPAGPAPRALRRAN